MCDRYLTGLKREVAEALALQNVAENDLNALIAAAERYDTVKCRRGPNRPYRPYGFLGRVSGGAHSESTPMEVDSARVADLKPKKNGLSP